jgi:hypothetical protein
MLVLVVIARENFDTGHFELFNFPGRWLLRPAFLAGITPCDVIMIKVYCLANHWNALETACVPRREAATRRHMTSLRLLARVLKEGVQFWYNDTSTVKKGGGGSRNRSSGKPLKFTLLHVSICSKLVRSFSNTFGFVSLCCYASLLNYDIFIQSGTPSNWSKCQITSGAVVSL